MHRTTSRRAHLPGIAALAGAALLVVACSSAAAPSPSPSPSSSPSPEISPSPSPTATPEDAATSFVKIITDPTFRAAASITGDMAFGAIEGTIVGSAILAPDSSMSTTMSLAGSTTTTETIEVGSDEWKRSNGGPWVLQDEPADDAQSLSAFLGAIAMMRDLGLETKSGQQLHHLQPPEGGQLPPEAIGLDDPAMTDTTVALDFFVKDDGTPVVMVLTAAWTQEMGGQPVPATMTMQFDLRDIGTAAEVEAPEDAWIRYRSTAFDYSMAHPEDWTVGVVEGQDAYAVDDQPYVYVAAQELPAETTLADFSGGLKADYKKLLGVDPAERTTGSLDGAAAEVLTYRFTNDSGDDVTLVDVVAVHEGMGWEVYLATATTESEAADIAVFDQFVSTFAFND